MLHCAASISFDLPLEEARAINVEGTREVIGFAREARRSGAWSASCTSRPPTCRASYEGTFRERQLDAGQEFRNTYEQTKWEAEHDRAARPTTSRPAIARPSIVMGESDTGWTPGLQRPLLAAARVLARAVRRDPGAADGRVDVVPVDYVADALVHLLDRAEAGVFNLVAGRDAPTRERARRARAATASTGRGPSSSSPAATPDDDEHGAVYLPYFDMDVVFDDSRARALLEPGRHPRRRGWPTTSAR